MITCVDTPKARREVHEVLWGPTRMNNVAYWLDCGNLATVGQVVLGQPPSAHEKGWPKGVAFDPRRAVEGSAREASQGRERSL